MSTNKYAHLAPPKRQPPRLVRMHEGKIRWKTLREAAGARDSAAAHYGEDFTAYFCPICSGYHIGHRRTW
ncbi:MAG TPA: hypothetical protein VFQ25_10385 [Ktedonobacterales bacterium]|nr:hypothetical protein [Ktedonobacterales bacterium]